MSRFDNLLGIINTFKNWYTYIFDWLGLFDDGFSLYNLRDGTKFLARNNTDDKYIITSIFSREEFNPKGFKIGKDDLVFDIGGHIGIFSINASHFTENKIYTFEPNLQNFAMLVINLKINDVKNIKPFMMAITNKTGYTRLYLSNKSACHSTYKHFKNSLSEKVSCISLSDFINIFRIKKIDFLKINCEGAEFDILFNLPKNIYRKIKKMVVQCHDINKLDKLKTFIQNNGFSVVVNGETLFCSNRGNFR